MVTGTSALWSREALIGMPISAVTRQAVSRARFSSAAASRSMAVARSARSARGQGPESKASRAARTAMSTSLPEAAGAEPMISSVAGLATVTVSGDDDGSRRPPA